MMPVCSICGSVGRVCGDDHMTYPPIGSYSIEGTRSMNDTTDVDQQPVALSEYEYFVGHVKMTAQMSAEHAEAVGAKPVGELGDTPDDATDNKNAERMSSHMAKSDTNGVDGENSDAMDKARNVRNRRAH